MELVVIGTVFNGLDHWFLIYVSMSVSGPVLMFLFARVSVSAVSSEDIKEDLIIKIMDLNFH